MDLNNGDPRYGLQPNNPFLAMLAAVEDDGDDGVGQQEPLAGAGQQIQGEAPHLVQRHGKVNLGEFWPQAPNAWFAAAELKFEVAGIHSERERFAHTVGAMGFNTLRHVMDLVERPPQVQPYTTLKGRLVLAHDLSPVQKAAKLLQLPTTSDCRPSEILASLLEFCPPGEENTAIFRATFTTRLSPNIQVHLAGSEMVDLKQLALAADRLWLCHGPQHVAAVQKMEEEDTVAALSGGAKGKQFFRKKKLSEGKQQQSKKSWAESLCWKHAQYGAKAHNCADAQACTWTGN